jgi:hypothetical protein
MQTDQHFSRKREVESSDVDMLLWTAAKCCIAVGVLAWDDEFGLCKFANNGLTAAERTVWLHRDEVCCRRLLTGGFVEV